MLYQVSILTALLSVALGSRLGKEDGGRKLLEGYPYSQPSYGGGSTYNPPNTYSPPNTYGGGSTYTPPNTYGGTPTYGGGPSYGGGSSYSRPTGPSFDGSYRFTCLGETFQVNVCGSQGYSTYIPGPGNNDASITFNVEGSPDLIFHDYVFGVFRSPSGVQPIGNTGAYELRFHGFQFQMPTGINYDLDLEYSIIQSRGNFILVRDDDKEEFSLERLSTTALQECMEPGQSFTNPNTNVPPQPFPANFQSVNLRDTGLCSEPTGVDCFEMGRIDMIPFGAGAQEGDSCFAVYDGIVPPFDGPLPEPITGGIHLRNGPPESTQPDTFFNGNIVLASFIQQQFRSELASCRVGPVFYGLDRNDGNAIILNFRCSEGQDGFTYRLFRTNRQESCPFFVLEDRKRYSDRPERGYGGRRDVYDAPTYGAPTYGLLG